MIFPKFLVSFFYPGEKFLENFGIKITGIPEGWGPDPSPQ
jgi:hypothetical protein